MLKKMKSQQIKVFGQNYFICNIDQLDRPV